MKESQYISFLPPHHQLASINVLNFFCIMIKEEFNLNFILIYNVKKYSTINNVFLLRIFAMSRRLN